MRPEIKTKWLEALRSGEYQQGRSRLRTSRNSVNGYCCLGVLCDLHAKETNQKWTDNYEYLDCRHCLPEAVCTWAGFPTPTEPDHTSGAVLAYNPTVALPKLQPHQRTLASLNDTGMADTEFGRGCSFTEIADVIEKHL